jgi:hypothetical protein
MGTDVFQRDGLRTKLGQMSADEIRELMLEPARQGMVQGEASGGNGSR